MHCDAICLRQGPGARDKHCQPTLISYSSPTEQHGQTTVGREGYSIDNANSRFKAPFKMRLSATCTLSPGGQDKEHLCKMRLPFFKDRGLSGY